MNISLLRPLVCLKSKGWQVSGVTSFVDVGTLICNLGTQISVKLLQQWELFKVSRRLFWMHTSQMQWHVLGHEQWPLATWVFHKFCLEFGLRYINILWKVRTLGVNKISA